MSLKENILEKIKKGEIKKEPRWYFLTKKYSLWTSAILSVILGGIGFSIFLKNYFDDFGPWYKIKLDNSFFLSNILYFWLLSFLIFLIISFLAYSNTKNAFRYKKTWIIFGNLFLSIILGILFYYSHLGYWVDSCLEKRFKNYWNLKQEKRLYLIQELEKKGIDPEEFFRNKKVLEKRRKYEIIDQKRIDRIRKVLDKSRGNPELIQREKEVLERIKEKKEEVDKKRMEKLIEIYQSNN